MLYFEFENELKFYNPRPGVAECGAGSIRAQKYGLNIACPCETATCAECGLTFVVQYSAECGSGDCLFIGPTQPSQ